eukprot:13072293-Alexandrium_andersonii.AAC.1
MGKPGPPTWFRSESVEEPGLDAELVEELSARSRPLPCVVDSGTSHHAMSEVEARRLGATDVRNIAPIWTANW